MFQTTPTLDDKLNNVLLKTDLDWGLIFDLKGAIVGHDGVKFSFDFSKVDDLHKAYFKAHLKEESLLRALSGKECLGDEYFDFSSKFNTYSENKEDKGFFSFLSKFKSKKLNEDDTIFFKGLNGIREYASGQDYQDILIDLDRVFNKRESYLQHLPIEEDTISLNDAKQKIATSKTIKLYSALKEEALAHSGTLYMLPVLNNFLDGVISNCSDLGLEISVENKHNLFNILCDYYVDIVKNESIDASRLGEIIRQGNELPSKIYGVSKPLFDIETSGSSFNIVQTPKEYFFNLYSD